ncbi:MAG: hypothetical protein AAFR46_07525 [Pseudomonadota bacterium]
MLMEDDHLKALESRITTALDRIETALDAPCAAGEAAPNGELDAEIRSQAEEIDRLRGRLDEMKEARRRDADDVSAILADLRPLLEQ